VSARGEHAKHLGQRGLFVPVVQRVNDVEGGDDVEGPALKGKAGRGGLGDRALAALVRVGEAGPGQIDAGSTPVAAQHAQVVPGSASAVENLRRLDAARRVLHERRHEPPQPAEPEVIALGARGCLK
jgi:hypothetical protein